ncbi:MAG: NAD(P)-dependent oxidoreductase, partial [Lentisphaeria bacterium]|nr:NAD(P)-dependent oxidoreductase [Lentisphaeria bacterium]
ILRMSNVYGRGDVPLDGLGGRDPEYFKRIVRGEVVEVSENGRALLQPGHVEDLGRAFLACAQRPFTIGEVYNIGGDWSLMIKDYVRLIAKIFGTTAKLEFVDRTELRRRYGHADDFVCQHMCSDITKAARDLDWRPVINLEAGLRDNFEWMKEVGKL